MRACVQRVTNASVAVDGRTIGHIECGLVVLLGVSDSDTSKEVAWMANKIVGMRVFEDDGGKMNRSLLDMGGAMLVVSQFTLLGDCRKGRRPSFVAAAKPELAERLYEEFSTAVRGQGVKVATGQFRAMMQVSLTNDGPVTLVIDSP